MKHRLLRANELIRRELGAIIQRELDFDGALVTIHQVSVTPDLRNAHIYVSAIGGHIQLEHILAKLTDNRTLLQTEMAKRVILKYTPILRFHYDEAIERGSRVIHILENLDLPEEEDVDDVDTFSPDGESPSHP